MEEKEFNNNGHRDCSYRATEPPSFENESLVERESLIITKILTTLEDRLNDVANDIQSDKAIESRSLYEQGIHENALPTKDDGLEFAKIDPNLVTWDGPDDPENPINWSPKDKFLATILVSIYAFVTPFASSLPSPARNAMAEEFHQTNSVINSMILSIFLLSFAISPLFLTAPMSEMYGRKIVCDLSIWFMAFFNLACGFAKTSTQMIVFRFLAGLGGATPLAIGAGTVSDVFSGPGKYGAAKRGLAMAIFSAGPCFGPSSSTLIAGYIVEKTHWRWVFHTLTIFSFCLAIFGTIFFRETYAPVLLLRKKKRLVKETGNKNLKTLYEIADLETTWGKFEVNITRPFVMLCTNPMVFGLGLYMAICYGCLYVVIIAFPSVWIGTYHFSIGNSGLLYISFLLGYMIGLVFCAKTNDRYANMMTKKNGEWKPEYRLPFLVISGVLLTIGLFWFGWTVDTTYKAKPVMWLCPFIGNTIFAVGLVIMFQCTQTYLVDINPRFAASSLAAASFMRSLFGFAFPLFGPQMFEKLGYGVGCSIFGGLSILSGISFPLFLVYKGESMRLWANKRMESSRAKRDAKNLKRIMREQMKEGEK